MILEGTKLAQQFDEAVAIGLWPGVAVCVLYFWFAVITVVIVSLIGNPLWTRIGYGLASQSYSACADLGWDTHMAMRRLSMLNLLARDISELNEANIVAALEGVCSLSPSAPENDIIGEALGHWIQENFSGLSDQITRSDFVTRQIELLNEFQTERDD